MYNVHLFFSGISPFQMLSTGCFPRLSSELYPVISICEAVSPAQFSLSLETKLEMDTVSHTNKVQWRAVEDHLTKENKVQKKGVWRGLDQSRVNGISL